MRLPPAAASRANLLRGLLALAPAALLNRAPAAALEGGQLAFQPSLTGKGYGKTEMDYSDFERTPSGVLFKDAKKGSGKSPETGDRVVLDCPATRSATSAGRLRRSSCARLTVSRRGKRSCASKWAAAR